MTSLSEHPVDSFRVNLDGDVLTYPRSKLKFLAVSNTGTTTI